MESNPICEALTSSGQSCSKNQVYRVLGLDDNSSVEISCHFYCTQHCTQWITSILNQLASINVETRRSTPKKIFNITIPLDMDHWVVTFGADKTKDLRILCGLMKYMPSREVIPMKISIFYTISGDDLAAIPSDFNNVTTPVGTFLLSTKAFRHPTQAGMFLLEMFRTIRVVKN